MNFNLLTGDSEEMRESDKPQMETNPPQGLQIYW